MANSSSTQSQTASLLEQLTKTWQTTKPRPLSDKAFNKAKTLLPGGVNSPVRAFASVGGGTPVVVKKAHGAYLTDLDDHDYIDYVLSWGPAILGHAHPQVLQAVEEAMHNGLSFGCPSEPENALAEAVLAKFPAMDLVRFVSSGTEAVMSAIRLARAATNRTKIIKFEGCYHGHADSLLVKAGSGLASLGIPTSAGVTATLAQETLTAPFNQLEAVGELFEQYPDCIAGVLLEPVAGNMGCVPPVEGYLEGLRALCTQYGALLIFDEVMTGFRVDVGGVQTLYNIEPDITCLGKILGGGLPVGAYGGKRAIMEWVAPLGAMYQAGTLSGNPLGMAAGLATLNTIASRPHFYETLNQQTATLANGMTSLLKSYGIPCYTTQVGGMFSVFLSANPVNNYDDVCRSNRLLFNALFWGLVNEGVYLAPSPFEACFTAIAHTEATTAQTLEALETVLKALQHAKVLG
jgi:glutamate-1-semialdehyde 2,1-aminomutase